MKRRGSWHLGTRAIAIWAMAAAGFGLGLEALVASARAESLRDTSVTLERSLVLAMRERLAKPGPVRISGSFPSFDARNVTVDESALRYDDAFRFGVNPERLPASPIPWSRIERVEVANTRVRQGAAIGAVVGLAMGFVWSAYDPPRSQAGFLRWGPTAEGITVGRAIFATAMGTAIGAGIGYARRDWRPVYSSDAPIPDDSER